MKHATYFMLLSLAVLWLGPACASKLHSAQKKSLPAASIQPVTPTLRAGAISLAVLPWLLSGGHEDESIGIATAQEALETALGGTPFVPLYSAYALNRYPVTRIDTREKPSLRRVWKGGRPGPNQEVVYDLGKQLDVKALILYDLEIRHGDDYLWVYLADVTRRRLYQVKGQTYDFSESGYSELLHITRGVFAEYQRHLSP